MLRALGRDPLVLKYNRIDMVYGLVDLMDAAAAAAPRLSDNVLLLFGENEDIVPRGPINALLRNLRPRSAGGPRVAVYATGYHMLLRDLQAETVLADIAAWIRDPEAPLPSGADTSGADRVAAAAAP